MSSVSALEQGVDARVKPGHDESCAWRPQYLNAPSRRRRAAQHPGQEDEAADLTAAYSAGVGAGGVGGASAGGVGVPAAGLAAFFSTMATAMIEPS